MGRRKTPETLPEIRAEIEYAKEEKRKQENKVKLLANSLKKEENKKRTARLCNEAGFMEYLVPALKTMEKKDRDQFIEIAVLSESAQRFLQEGGFIDEAEDIDPN